jgi:hypothetical protein
MGSGRELAHQLRPDGRRVRRSPEFVEHPDDIAPALERAIASGKPAVVNICVDPDAEAAGGLLGALGSEQPGKE